MNEIQFCLNKATARLLDIQEENSGLKSRIMEILEVQVKNQEEMRKMKDMVIRSPQPPRVPNREHAWLKFCKGCWREECR